MSDIPRRYQLRRVKGYRKPEGAVSIVRPRCKWRNPYTVAEYGREPAIERGSARS